VLRKVLIGFAICKMSRILKYPRLFLFVFYNHVFECLRVAHTTEHIKHILTKLIIFLLVTDGNTCVNIEICIYARRSPVNICNHLKSYIYPYSILNSIHTSENKDKLDKVLYGNKLCHCISESNEACKYRE